MTEAPRDAAGRFVPARSALARREYQLIAQKHPSPSTLAPAEREAVAAFLGIRSSDLETAHAYAWQNPPGDQRLQAAPPQPVGPTDAEVAGMSPVDRRAMQLRTAKR